MSIEKLFSKRRQIRAAWDQIDIPSEGLIVSLIERAFKISPSKQNLFPFKIHAYGPDNNKQKEIIGSICSLWKTGSVNHWDDATKDGNFKSAEGDLNVKDWVFDSKGNDYRNAPWVFIFEQRLCKENNFVREHHDLHKDGHRFTQTDPKRFRELCNTKLTCIEVGMFLQTFAGLCLENNLGISYIRTFPEWQWKGKAEIYEKETNKSGGLDWSALPEITEAPLMIAQVGYVADIDDIFKSNSVDPNLIHWENKPDINDLLAIRNT